MHAKLSRPVASRHTHLVVRERRFTAPCLQELLLLLLLGTQRLREGPRAAGVLARGEPPQPSRACCDDAGSFQEHGSSSERDDVGSSFCQARRAVCLCAPSGVRKGIRE